MRRALIALLSAALLSAALTTPAAAANDDGYVCDQKDMTTVKTMGHELFDTPSRLCQFRMYFPFARPHIWTDEEYFLGGNLEFISHDELEEIGLARVDAIKYFQQIEQQLFFGPASTPDAQLAEVNLQSGPIIDAGGLIELQSYHVFAPHEPGLYKWRYEFNDPMGFQDPVVTRSDVCIEPASQKKGKDACPGQGYSYD